MRICDCISYVVSSYLRGIFSAEEWVWVGVFCFFKQKTAYEVRISDWSSDVCSSDLGFSVGEVGMLVLETVVRIRREYAGGKAIKAIARDLHISRKVIRKAIRAPEGAFDYQRKVQPLPRIGPFQARLDTLLEENEVRGRRERLRMTRIHALLEREGFRSSYDAVRRSSALWTAARRKVGGDGVTAFIPLMFKPCAAYQFEWSIEDVHSAGNAVRLTVVRT